jgi:hypothetical protein
MRQLVAYITQKLTKKQNNTKDRHLTIKMKLEMQENNRIHKKKKKITQNQLGTTKADKGNTLVIPYKKYYKQEIEEFIKTINFTSLS